MLYCMHFFDQWSGQSERWLAKDRCVSTDDWLQIRNDDEKLASLEAVGRKLWFFFMDSKFDNAEK